MVQNQVRKTGDLSMQFGRDRLQAEPLERVYQRVRKTVQPVSMLHHAFPLHIIEHLPHLLGRKLVMIQKRNEASDSPLKVNVVLPERVVGVDEKRLGLVFAGRTEQMCGAP